MDTHKDQEVNRIKHELLSNRISRRQFIERMLMAGVSLGRRQCSSGCLRGPRTAPPSQRHPAAPSFAGQKIHRGLDAVRHLRQRPPR